MTSLRRGPGAGKRSRGPGAGKRRREVTRHQRAGAEAPDPAAVRQGATILALVALVAAAIFLFDPIQRWLAAGPELVVTASSARDLQPGAAVWVAGKHSGRVTSVRLRPPEEAGGARVVVRAVLEEDAASRVRAGAEAWIRSSALLAPAVLAVTPGPRDAPPLDFGDTLRAVEPVTAMELASASGDVLAGLDSLSASAREIEQLLRRGDGTLGRLRRDTALRRTLRRDLAALRRATRAFGEGPAGAARSLRESGVLDSVARRAAALAALLPDRADALAELDRSLAALARRAGSIDEATARGRGTLGRLRADGELRHQIRLLRRELARTRTALVSDPFRWLRIRLF